MKSSASGRLPLAEEHPELHTAALGGIAALRGIGPSLSGSAWVHHHEHAERAGHVADHLEAALILASARNFASSYVLLRTAFEQACVDELLLLAGRYRQVVVMESEDAAIRAVSAWEAGTSEWPADIKSVTRKKAAVELVRVGHEVHDKDAGELVERISPYEPILQRHNAILGPPHIQADLAEAFADAATLRSVAQANRLIYHNYLSWSAIVDNLKLNELVTAREAQQLEVHYRFLSAFTHATQTGYRLIGEAPTGSLQPEHLLGELALLYVCNVSVAEATAFMHYSESRPSLTDFEDDSLRSMIGDGSETTSYMWFPRFGKPVPFDFFDEANRRAFPNGAVGERDKDAPPPDQIPVDEVGYYRNPLERLRSLHSGAHEWVTGYWHVPLWA